MGHASAHVGEGVGSCPSLVVERKRAKRVDGDQDVADVRVCQVARLALLDAGEESSLVEFS